MKQIQLLVLFLVLTFSASAQRYYKLTQQYDSVAINKLKLFATTEGALTDSILVKKPNGGVYKVARSTFGGSTPTLQSVTTGAGNNVTSNGIQITGAAGINPATNGLALVATGGFSQLANIAGGVAGMYMQLNQNSIQLKKGEDSPLIINSTEDGSTAYIQSLGRVSGNDAINSNDFVTKSQLDAVGGGTLQSVTTGTNNNRTSNVAWFNGTGNLGSAFNGTVIAKSFVNYYNIDDFPSSPARWSLGIVNDGPEDEGVSLVYSAGVNSQFTLRAQSPTKAGMILGFGGSDATPTTRLELVPALNDNEAVTLGQLKDSIAAGGGSTPTLQSVTTGAGNNVTSNAIQFNGFNGFDPAVDGGSLLSDGEGGVQINSFLGGNNIGQIGFNADGTFALSGGSGIVLEGFNASTGSLIGSFKGRVNGSAAAASNEFTTLSQLQDSTTLSVVLGHGNVANDKIILADFYTDDTDYQGLELGASTGNTTLANHYGTMGITSDVALKPGSAELNYYGDDGGATPEKQVSLILGYANNVAGSGIVEVRGTTNYANIRAAEAVNDDDLVPLGQLNNIVSTVGLSGSYTPTITNEQGIANSSLLFAKYTRIGNIVNVTVKISFDTDATTSQRILHLTIPVSTVIGGANPVVGIMSARTATDMYIQEDAASQRVEATFTQGANIGSACTIMFTYEVTP